LVVTSSRDVILPLRVKMVMENHVKSAPSVILFL